MAVRGQRSARDDALLNYGQGTLYVLPYRRSLASVRPARIEKGDALIQQAGICGCDEVLGQDQHWPKDNIAMGIARPDVALAFEEHEPLWPISVCVLRAHHAQEQIAYGLSAAQRKQHFDGPLADVARAPTAARVLLQASRRQVMHERVVCEPRRYVCDA